MAVAPSFISATSWCANLKDTLEWSLIFRAKCLLLLLLLSICLSFSFQQSELVLTEARKSQQAFKIF